MSTNSIEQLIVSKLQGDINSIIAERDAAINTANIVIAAANEIMTHKKGSKYRLVPKITAADLGAPLSYLRVNDVKLRTGAEQTTHMLTVAGLSFSFKKLNAAPRVIEVYSPDTTLRVTLNAEDITVELNGKLIEEGPIKGHLNDHMKYTIDTYYYGGYKDTCVKFMRGGKTFIGIYMTLIRKVGPQARINIGEIDDGTYHFISWNYEGEMEVNY